jgi:hypothetical protein
MTWRRSAILGVLAAATLHVIVAASSQSSTAGDLASAIDRLGSFDFAARTEALRVVRRTPAEVAVPALERAARSHKDEYVRFRALVSLASFGEGAAGGVMRDVIADRNDRLRAVAYQWFERHPAPAVLPTLLAALPAERSEFVRPALTRSIAAHANDARARDALLPLVMRGEDFFRGALIEALGDHGGRFAAPQIVAVAKLDGPLQDDAITAIGKLGDASARPVLAALQQSAPREVQPTISAAFCLMGVDCARQEAYLTQVLTYAVESPDHQPLLRGVAHALGVLAVKGRPWAADALLNAGVKAAESARAPIALSVGLLALRNPDQLCGALERRTDVATAVDLVRDAFDMLSEDFDEELFYTAVRRMYWEAPEGSARRRTAQLLIDQLEL